MQSKPWTYADLDMLYKEYAYSDTEELAKKMNRTVQSVESKALHLNLYKSVSFTNTEKKTAEMFGKELGTALIFLMPDRTVTEVEVLLSCEKDQLVY